jgi:hypothetical protein
VFIVAVPVPLVIPLYAQVPAARILMLGVVSFATMFVETTRGAVVPLAFLFLAQALVAVGALWLVAYALSRLLARLTSGPRALITVGIVVAVLAVTTARSLYLDPYRPQTLRSNLTRVYE